MKKIFILLSTLILISLFSNTVSAQFTEYDYELIDDIIVSLETFTYAIWIFVIIIASLLITFIILCILMLNMNKKYLKKIDQLLEIKHMQSYGPNWQNQDKFSRY